MNALPEEILRCFRKDFTEHLSYEELQHLKRLKNSFEKKEKVERISNDFMVFVKEMWPEFIQGRHHKEIAKKFNKIANGKCKRLIINMPPRHTKSEFSSFLLPAWMVGRKPDLKIIQDDAIAVPYWHHVYHQGNYNTVNLNNWVAYGPPYLMDYYCSAFLKISNIS